MKKQTNQELILCSLFESPKTTGQLASELNYINSKGIPHYSIIYKDLQRLLKSGYVENKKEKLEKTPGNTPTLYSIFYSRQSLNNMLEEFPNLTENMQRSELVLETIINENFSWICNSSEEKVEQIESFKLSIQIGKESWKEKLKLSKEFFRFCLKNSYIYMIERIRKLAQISSEYWETTVFEFQTTPTTSVISWETNYRIDMIFKACVVSDILKGESKPEAVEYLEQRKNEALEEQYQQLREYYNNTKVVPEFLRGKEFTPVENSKLRELEQEFIDKGGKFVNNGI